MTTQYWLVKSEPEAYAWADLVRDGRTDWTGVRNYAARNNLSAMRRGDQSRLRYVEYSGGTHSEAAWAAQLPDALIFLNLVNKVHPVHRVNVLTDPSVD